jgi:OPT family oligopeptide transporter
MPLFQAPPKTEAEIEAAAPLDIPPEDVQKMTDEEWYARAYRGDDAPQLTLRAVLMGSVLGFFLSFTNVYIGLKTGWFLGVALTACILSFAIWNGLRSLGAVKSQMTILENNCMQSTASSAGYATGNTVVSAIPAMLLLSVSQEHPAGVQLKWPILALWVFFLAALGVTLAIPLKRNMINREKLPFPSGTAAAIMLQGFYSHGKEALQKARALLGAGLVALVPPLLKDLNVVKKIEDGKVVREALLPGFSNVFDFVPSIHAAGKSYKPSDFTMKLEYAFALAGAGAIVGFRVTFWMVIGGAVLAFFLAPHAMEATWVNPAGKLVAAASKPGTAWKEIGLWVGAPMLVSAGLTHLALQAPAIARAFRGITSASGAQGEIKDARGNKVDVSKVEPPTQWFLIGALCAGTGVVVVAWLFFEVPLHMGALAVLMMFVLGLVACRITGETDITPGGPLGKLVQLAYGVLLPQSTTANLMTAGITSGSSLAAADLLNDLKSGYLLGANPRRQFIAQALGILTGTVATTLCYFVLVPDATPLLGEGGRDPQFAAPGAQQWKAVAEVFKYGIANLHPMARQCIFWGLAIGAVLALLEAVFKKHKKWIPSANGLGLGLLLPFFIMFAFFWGACVAEIAKRVSPRWAERFVVPIAAGLIAGESIVGVIVAALNNFVLK